MKKTILTFGILVTLFPLFTYASNCKKEAGEEVVKQYSSTLGHVVQISNYPTETLELSSGRKFEIWTSYISNPDQSNEKAAVVQLNAKTCKVLKFNFLY